MKQISAVAGFATLFAMIFLTLLSAVICFAIQALTIGLLYLCKILAPKGAARKNIETAIAYAMAATPDFEERISYRFKRLIRFARNEDPTSQTHNENNADHADHAQTQQAPTQNTTLLLQPSAK